MPFFIVTHRPEEQPDPAQGFTFVGDLDGFEKSLELEHLGVRQSRYATFIDYRVMR